MSRLIIALLFFNLTAILYSQDTGMGFAGIRPQTHTLIIGISDYGSLDDLQFADRDALIFRQYLTRTIESSSDTNNIVTLLNDKATSPAIYKSLEDLVALAGEGDKIYIYFSGHGDSENTTIFKSGFLLTHDTPEGNYYTNSLNIDILNNFIHTLSGKNKADVIFIADACRSGKLGFTGGNGMTVTAKALAENVADEVRVLSCQPNEISLEGEQWGDGRGLFSYHLINGLYGMADMLSIPDGKVSLNELNIYLSTNVPRDAEPVSQFPGIYGPMNKQIGSICEVTLSKLMKDGRTENALVRKGNRKGYEDRFSGLLNEEQIRWSENYHQAIKQGRLDGSDNDHALNYFRKLQASSIDPVLESLLKRELIAALQEEAQLFIHHLADVHIRWQAKDMKYGKWARHMKLSAELLGSEHYLYETLLGKHYFFASTGLYFKAKANRSQMEKKQQLNESIRLINLALKADPNVIVYHNLKGVAVSMLNYPDQAITIFDKAIRINPHYPYPYSNKGWALIKKGEFEEALESLEQCIKLAPYYTNAYQYKITALKKLGRDTEAMEVYQQIIGLSNGKIGM
ncbi:MAG: tetratricopeptide repeat protein [Bacteroidetes bacterium]|nr:tetratricopeptide repeat protein [Bacteroidota bacterium]